MRLSPPFKSCGSDALRRKGGGVGGGNVGLGSPVVVIHIVGYDCKIQISQSSSHVDVNTEPFVRTVVFKHAVAVAVVEAHGSDSRRLGGEQSIVDRQPVRRRCRVFIVHACQVVAVGIEAELMVCSGIGGESIEWLQSHFASRSVGDGKLAAHVAGTQTGCPLFAGREVHIFSGCSLCAHHDVVRQIFSRIGKRNRHKSLSHTAFYVDRGFFILFHAVWLFGKKCRGNESLLILVAVAGGKIYSPTGNFCDPLSNLAREAHDFTVAVRQFMAERAKASAEGASTSMPAAPATGVTEGSTDSRNRTSPYPVTNGFGSLLHAASSRHNVACKKLS